MIMLWWKGPFVKELGPREASGVEAYVVVQ